MNLFALKNHVHSNSAKLTENGNMLSEIVTKTY